VSHFGEKNCLLFTAMILVWWWFAARALSRDRGSESQHLSHSMVWTKG